MNKQANKLTSVEEKTTSLWTRKRKKNNRIHKFAITHTSKPPSPQSSLVSPPLYPAVTHTHTKSPNWSLINRLKFATERAINTLGEWSERRAIRWHLFASQPNTPCLSLWSETTQSEASFISSSRYMLHSSASGNWKLVFFFSLSLSLRKRWMWTWR